MRFIFPNKSTGDLMRLHTIGARNTWEEQLSPQSKLKRREKCFVLNAQNIPFAYRPQSASRFRFRLLADWTSPEGEAGTNPYNTNGAPTTVRFESHLALCRLHLGAIRLNSLKFRLPYSNQKQSFLCTMLMIPALNKRTLLAMSRGFQWNDVMWKLSLTWRPGKEGLTAQTSQHSCVWQWLLFNRDCEGEMTATLCRWSRRNPSQKSKNVFSHFAFVGRPPSGQVFNFAHPVLQGRQSLQLQDLRFPSPSGRPSYPTPGVFPPTTSSTRSAFTRTRRVPTTLIVARRASTTVGCFCTLHLPKSHSCQDSFGLFHARSVQIMS